MTTIIAQAGTLTADRRVVVNQGNAGMIGVKDESKITKLPFCLYAIAGYNFNEDRADKINPLKAEVHKRLALYFGMSYFLPKHLSKTPFYKLIEENELEESYEDFVDSIIIIRRLIGDGLASRMSSTGRALIAASRTTLITTQNKLTMAHDVGSTHTLGTGSTMASILMNHGLSMEEIYSAVRESGSPTGKTFDHYVIADELPEYFPPVTDPDFLATLFVYGREEKGNMSPASKDTRLRMLTEVLATFCSIGELVDGHMRFNAVPKFKFKTEEDFAHPAYVEAASMTKYKPKQENTK